MPLGEALDLLIAVSIFAAVLGAAVIYGQSWRAVARAFEYAASHPSDDLNGDSEQDLFVSGATGGPAARLLPRLCAAGPSSAP